MTQLIASSLLALMLGGCTELFPCENANVHRVPSPDGELEAVVFERDCGATTDLSYHVSVLPAGDSLANEPGNTFVAGRPEDMGTLVSGPLIGWLGDSVHVFYVVPREVHKQEQSVAGRVVFYETGDGIDIVQ